MKILGLFPKTISTDIIDITNIELNNILNDFKKEEYDSSYENNSTLSSKNKNILKNYPILKSKILDSFNLFKNNILKYNHQNFEFTTSWITKTNKDNYTHLHFHKNCMYSGVYYPLLDNQTTSIRFLDSNSNSFLLEPTEYNIHNSINQTINVEKNMVIFFPSDLLHSIINENLNFERYSIAFNLIPRGNLGNISNDSFLKL